MRLFGNSIAILQIGYQLIRNFYFTYFQIYLNKRGPLVKAVLFIFVYNSKLRLRHVSLESDT